MGMMALLSWTSCTTVPWIYALQLGLRSGLSPVHPHMYLQVCVCVCMCVCVCVVSCSFNIDPRLHLLSILKGKSSGCTLWQGLQCSSWVSICKATSMRSFLNPLGNQNPRFVAMGNEQLCRTTPVIKPSFGIVCGDLNIDHALE